jgi:hypothetical protein
LDPFLDEGGDSACFWPEETCGRTNAKSNPQATWSCK